MSDTDTKEIEEVVEVEVWNALVYEPVWWKPWVTVIYVDGPQYLSANSFAKHGIRPFRMKFFERDDTPYMAVLCNIPKKRLDDFLECMAELQKNMLICGYVDYEDFCRTLQAEFEAAEDEE